MSGAVLFGWPIRLTVEVDREEIDVTSCLVFSPQIDEPALSVDVAAVARSVDEHKSATEEVLLHPDDVTVVRSANGEIVGYKARIRPTAH